MKLPRLQKLTCRIIGHQWSPIAARHGYGYCDRCLFDSENAIRADGEQDDPPWTLGDWFWLMRSRGRTMWRRMKLTLRRPDPIDDDVPF